MKIPSIRKLIGDGERHLVERGVPNARRNAEWILSDTLGCRSADLYLEPLPTLSSSQLNSYERLIERRGQREPLQYLLGNTEFMSLPFYATPGVFIPRPDTEIVVEQAEALIAKAGRVEPVVLDLCSGSGVIGISLLCRVPECRMIAVDMCDRATALTARNATLNGVSDRLEVLRADAGTFLRNNTTLLDAIVCNPPYVPSNEMSSLMPEIRSHEPAGSLDGGADGLDFYRAVGPLFAGSLHPGGVVVLEIGASQGRRVADILHDAEFTAIEVRADYSGADRVVTGRKSLVPPGDAS